MPTIRYALIGCGRIAPNHIAAALAQPDIDIVALCDLVPENMDKILSMVPKERRAGMKLYTSHNDLLACEKPVLCAIATDSGSHARVALDCIEAGAHIIVEKPMAMTLSDADAMIEQAQKKGVLVCACHQNRFNKSIQKVREAVETGRFGKLLHGAAHIRWNRGEDYYKQAPWRGTWRHDGGALMNQCIHNIDLLRWMLGDEITEVFAYTDNLKHPYIEAEDLGLAMVKFASGAYGLIEGTTNVYPQNMEETLYVFGDSGTVKVGGKSVNIIEEWHFDDEQDDPESVKAQYAESPPNVYGFGHTPLYADMVDAIQNNRPPYIDGFAGRRALELILAIYRSSKEGQPVTLPIGNPPEPANCVVEDNTKEMLLTKINNRSLTVGVIGLGYVGLPLAVEKALAGYKTIGFDIQEEKVAKINRGENYIGDVVNADLESVTKSGAFSATSDFSFIRKVDCVAICVPTPLDEHKQPNISHVKHTAEELAKYIHKDMLVILESTTYPGTTEELLKPILESSGLVCGKDFYLAFSPERVDPGNLVYKTKNTPKVVGGVGREAAEIVAALYRSVLDSDVMIVSSPAVAEMEKLLENTYRNVNIALANEMAQLCDKMGINVWEVIAAAKTKPYGFQAFYPGAGVGGHCIPLDPAYLSWKALEYGFHTKLIELSNQINDGMPAYVVSRAARILNRDKKPLNGSKILLLGVAYKQDIDDYRESPALKVMDLLEEAGCEVTYFDPYVSVCQHKGKSWQGLDKLTEAALNEADLVIITAAHSGVDYDLVCKHAKDILDTKNVIVFNGIIVGEKVNVL